VAKKIVKVCLFSPYFPDHFGGGERHLLDIAAHLSPTSRVCIAFPEAKAASIDLTAVKENYEKFYGASLETVAFITTPVGTRENFFRKLFWTRQFSHIFAVSDGSLFFSLAKHNIAHLQIPFSSYPQGFLNQLKLAHWRLNTNAYFTKRVIEHSWKTRVSSVLQPMVANDLFALAQKKEKIILHVGRFFTQLHSKRQDVLVETFRKLLEKSPAHQDWRLVLVGSVEDEAYLANLRVLSRGLPIEFKTNCSRVELLGWYARASIYWHATGFGADEESEPEKVEHFGITTIEAMAAGVVPVVLAKGGQVEILNTELQSLSWQTQEECVEQTSKLLASETLLRLYQDIARRRAAEFGEARFVKQLEAVFGV